MSNTIELLERIGQDASLRHSSQENLAQALNALNASEGLKLTVASGDKSHLGEELGHSHQPVRVNHNDGGCDPCGDETENQPKRDGDDADKAHPASDK